MKKKHMSLLRGIAVCVNAAAAAVLAVGFVAGMRAGYGSETWKEILGGKNYVETAEFQEQAASSVYDALEAAVRDSRMEKDGQYDPQRIIRLRDYLDNGAIYDEMPEKEKGNQRAGGQGDAGDCDQHLGAEAEGFVGSIILLKNRMFSHGVR